MTEFNPNCGKCGMLNSRGFCSLTACRYPSNAIVVEPKVIRGMMVKKAETNADNLRAMSNEELADFLVKIKYPYRGDGQDYAVALRWLQSPVEPGEVDNGNT